VSSFFSALLFGFVEHFILWPMKGVQKHHHHHHYFFIIINLMVAACC